MLSLRPGHALSRFENATISLEHASIVVALSRDPKSIAKNQAGAHNTPSGLPALEVSTSL
jgi:hypothetical protein